MALLSSDCAIRESISEQRFSIVMPETVVLNGRAERRDCNVHARFLRLMHSFAFKNSEYKTNVA